MSLHTVPIGLDEANAFVAAHHRHHKPVQTHKFSIGAANEGGEIIGVAIVNIPVARMRNDGWTLEVTRLCTDGTRNACSFLYAAAWRAARAMGFKRLGTYILDTEDGATLRASGWHFVHKTSGGSWDRPSRPRVDKHPLQAKLLFEISA